MKIIKLMIISDILQLISYISSILSTSRGRIDEQNILYYISIIALYPLIAFSFILLIINICTTFNKSMKEFFIGILLNIHVIIILLKYFNVVICNS
jgi:hypothetical protein